jgi:hypothetical protein
MEACPIRWNCKSRAGCTSPTFRWLRGGAHLTEDRGSIGYITTADPRGTSPDPDACEVKGRTPGPHACKPCARLEDDLTRSREPATESRSPRSWRVQAASGGRQAS